MAELLVMLEDRARPDAPDRGPRAGDVVEVRPDGWAWGRVERAAAFFAIVRAPGLTVDEVEDLLEPDVDAGGALIGWRKKFLDFRRLSKGNRDKVMARRAARTERVEIAKGPLLGARSVRKGADRTGLDG